MLLKYCFQNYGEIIHFVKTWEDGGVESFLEIMREKFGDKIFVKKDHDKVSYKDFKDQVIIFHFYLHIS